MLSIVSSNALKSVRTFVVSGLPKVRVQRAAKWAEQDAVQMAAVASIHEEHGVAVEWLVAGDNSLLGVNDLAVVDTFLSKFEGDVTELQTKYTAVRIIAGEYKAPEQKPEAPAAATATTEKPARLELTCHCRDSVPEKEGEEPKCQRKGPAKDFKVPVLVVARGMLGGRDPSLEDLKDRTIHAACEWKGYRGRTLVASDVTWYLIAEKLMKAEAEAKRIEDEARAAYEAEAEKIFPKTKVGLVTEGSLGYWTKINKKVGPKQTVEEIFLVTELMVPPRALIQFRSNGQFNPYVMMSLAVPTFVENAYDGAEMTRLDIALAASFPRTHGCLDPEMIAFAATQAREAMTTEMANS